MMKENTRLVWDYIKAHDGEKFTAKDIAEAIGSTDKSVNGSVTAFQKKKYVERVAAEVELPDGTHKPVKLIVLTDAGRAFDPDAEVEEQ